MTLHEISSTDYLRLFPKSQVVYNTPAFTELNASKVKRVIRLMFESDHGKPVLGLTVGETADGMFKAPFSAPFACFDFNKHHGASTFIDAFILLRSTYPNLQITLPPAVYSAVNASMLYLAAITAGAVPVWTDWNYHIDLCSFEPGEFDRILDAQSRRKLMLAKREHFKFQNCDILHAYEIVKRNHESRGYPMRMSAKLLDDTTSVNGPISADSFSMTDKNGRDIAAAIIYKNVSEMTAQLIYWGNDQAADGAHPMNLLAASIAELLKAANYKIFDIGPSSEGGKPNLGLCRFKESIGCRCTVKPTLILPIFNA